MNSLPDFLCVGAQKSGTTSLYNILKQHSEIFLPEIKELHFFDSMENFNLGPEKYKSFFKHSDNYKIIGEITPNYMYIENCAELIYRTLGSDIKLIFILRNPADRAFSHYKMRIGMNCENISFSESVKLELNELKKDQYCLDHRYIDRGFYSRQIKRYLNFFDIRNMHFILFEEDFILKRKETIMKLLRFLGVNEYENISVNIKSTPAGFHKSKIFNKILNTSHPINRFAKKIIPNKKTRTEIKYRFIKWNQKTVCETSELEELRPMLIHDIFKNDINELENIIGRNLSTWYKS